MLLPVASCFLPKIGIDSTEYIHLFLSLSLSLPFPLQLPLTFSLSMSLSLMFTLGNSLCWVWFWCNSAYMWGKRSGAMPAGYLVSMHGAMTSHQKQYVGPQVCTISSFSGDAFSHLHSEGRCDKACALEEEATWPHDYWAITRELPRSLLN